MTLREAIDETIRLCWEGATTQPPTPSQALFVFNDALLHASFVTHYFLRSKSYDNVNKQVVETDSVRLLRVFWNNQPLNRFTLSWMNVPDATANEPRYYMDIQGRIVLFPAPSSQGTLKTIELGNHPTFTANDLSDSNKVIEFPPRLHRFLCLYAAGSYLMAYPESIQRAQLYQQEANAMFLEYRRQFEENQRQPMRNIANSMMDWTFDLVAPFRPNIYDEAIARAIDDAVMILLAKHRLLENIVTVSVPAGSRYVNLNNYSVIRVFRVYRETDEGRWVPLTSWDGHYDLLAERNREGVPSTYVAYGNRLELYPRPSTTTTLKIEGAIVPSQDGIDFIPAHLHRTVALYAAGLLLESVVTEKGVSVGAAYQQKALAEWAEWVRNVHAQVIRHDDYATALIQAPAYDTIRMWRD